VPLKCLFKPRASEARLLSKQRERNKWWKNAEPSMRAKATPKVSMVCDRECLCRSHAQERLGKNGANVHAIRCGVVERRCSNSDIRSRRAERSGGGAA